MRCPAFFIASFLTRLKEARDVEPVYGRPAQSTGLLQRPMTRALALSLLVHGALIAIMVLSVGHRSMSHQEMIRVSLVDDLPLHAATLGKAGESGTTAASAEAPRGANRGVPQNKKERMLSPRSVPAPPRPPVPIEEAVSEKWLVSREPVPDADPVPPAPQTRASDFPATGQGNANGGDHAASDGGVAGGASRGSGLGSGTGVAGTGQSPGVGSGTGGSGTGSGQTTYLREHFVYIRDLIMKNLRYPATARKLGWKGAVTVSFVVLENGAAQDIRVIKSSGHNILDKAVIKTIQETQPFPKPPAKAELTIPIVFRLEAGTGLGG